MLKRHQWLCSHTASSLCLNALFYQFYSFCLVCNPSEPTSKLNTLCSHPCIWRCWLRPPREAVSPRRGQTEEAHRNSVPSYLPRSLLQKVFLPEALRESTKRQICPAGKSPRVKQEKSLLPGNDWH